ncbi:MAG: Tyrocidine synthase 3 [Chlamydiae bacterium]|nr:Tyrocidine synthase 3 [Chlamydiota bacterium]
MSTLPISDSQLFFIMWHSLLGGAGLCYHFDIEGPLDVQKLESSLEHVVNSHPMLLSILDIPENATSFASHQLKAKKREGLSLRKRNLSKLLPEEISNEIQSEYLRLLNKKTRLDQWPLIEFTLFKLNDHSFHFFMGIDHVISDGLSSLEILHQIFSHYEGKEMPIQSADEYRDLSTKINQYSPDTTSLAETEEFLEGESNKAFFWNPNGKEKSHPSSSFHTESYILTKQETNHLLQATSELRGSLFSILVASYCEVLTSIAPSKTLEFSLPTSGRIYPEIDLQNTIGCFAQALTISFQEERIDMPFPKKVHYIEQKIQQGLHGNVDKILAKKMGTSLRKNYKLSNGKPSEFSKLLFQSSMKSNLYISFTGQSPLQKRYGDLKIDNYEEGTFNNPFSLDFMHSIFDGKLHIFANYDPSFFETTFVQKILEKIGEHLKNVFHENYKTQADLRKRTFIPPEINERLFSIIFNLTSLRLTDENILDDLEGCHGIDSLAKIRLVTEICTSFNKNIDKGNLIQSRSIYELGQVINGDA